MMAPPSFTLMPHITISYCSVEAETVFHTANQILLKAVMSVLYYSHTEPISSSHRLRLTALISFMLTSASSLSFKHEHTSTNIHC